MRQALSRTEPSNPNQVEAQAEAEAEAAPFIALSLIQCRAEFINCLGVLTQQTPHETHAMCKGRAHGGRGMCHNEL